MKKYLIGMGNYARGDDGIGLRIVEHIIDNNLDNGFTAIEAANDGLSVLASFSEETKLILIADCAMIDKKPGEYLVFDINDVDSKKIAGNISTHDGDILKIVGMARNLGYHVPPIKILAVQPESMDMEMSLSSLLESQLQVYVDKAISVLTSDI